MASSDRAVLRPAFVRSTRELGRASLKRSRRDTRPLLDLAPGGVYLATTVTCRAGGLLHHRFTLTAVETAAVCFLWHCPAGHPGWALATTLPLGARTFLNDVRRCDRPAGSPAVLLGYALTGCAPSARNTRVLILLPPSEGKARPDGANPSLDLASLTFASLTPTREQVLDALVRLCRGRLATACKTLGISKGQADEVARNAVLRDEPAAPARNVFTGVLFQHLEFASLPRSAQSWFDRHTLISSGLFGFVAPNDAIPAYRLSADTTLPRIGSNTALYRRVLAPPMREFVGNSLIVDARSQVYANMWLPEPEKADRLVSVRILQRSVVNGREQLKVVSHHNKATKGLLVRALAAARVNARTPTALADAVRDLGFEAHIAPAAHGSWQLDVITAPLPPAKRAAKPRD